MSREYFYIDGKWSQCL